ncbi:One cut domain family member [Fasciola hepatica]|uniref:One cut domain family member n=1 Tax=Fasciola hepatica TaxID=6192 RepID=A0A4E0RFX1_FASHE|nr:One cut domain family member [Fasciola hepatica]
MLGKVHSTKEAAACNERQEDTSITLRDKDSTLYFVDSAMTRMHSAHPVGLDELESSCLSVTDLSNSSIDCCKLDTTLSGCASTSITTTNGSNGYYYSNEACNDTLNSTFMISIPGPNSYTNASHSVALVGNLAPDGSETKPVVMDLSNLPVTSPMNVVDSSHDQSISGSTGATCVSIKSIPSSAGSPHNLPFSSRPAPDSSQISHTQLTNRIDVSELDEQLSISYLTNDGTALAAQRASQLPTETEAQLHAHAQANTRTNNDGPPTAALNATVTANYNSLNTISGFSNFDAVSDHFQQTHPHDLLANVMSSTIETAPEVMNYLQENGPVAYGQTATTLKAMNRLDSKPFPGWNISDLDMNQGIDGSVGAIVNNSSENIQRIHGSALGFKTQMGVHPIIPVSANIMGTHLYDGVTNCSDDQDKTSNNLDTTQLRGCALVDNLVFRQSQPQNCYPYGAQEIEMKPELKSVLTVHPMQQNQNHLNTHPCRPVMMNGQLVPPHLAQGPLNMQHVVPTLPARHGPLQHSMQDMEEINTKVLAQRISAELKRYSIPQAVFAQRVLCRSQGTLSDLLRNPKPWSKLKSGRETFRRMWKWLQEPEFQRMSALRLAACKRKEVEHVKNSESRHPKKPRLVFTDIQRRTLHAIFKETKRPSKDMQSTIAQQLGLEVSTVANFFMNARRRSLDKWQEDASKASSLAESPSPGSPSSRSGQLPRSASATMCCMKEGDSNSMEPCSPGSRRLSTNSMNLVGQIPSNKTNDGSYMSAVARSELGRLTRSSCLSNGNNAPTPTLNGQSALGINGANLFNSIHRTVSSQPAFASTTPVSNLVNPVHLSGAPASNLAHLSGAYTGNTFVNHHEINQLNSTTRLYHMHQQHPLQHAHHPGIGLQKPVMHQTPFMDRGDVYHPSSSNPTVIHCPSKGALSSVLLRDPTYPHGNGARAPHAFVFPSGGMHTPQAIGAPHLNLFHSGSAANGAARNHFLMRDLGAGSQFDHHFLDTMSTGQRALTAQALELCNSLAAANVASLSTGEGQAGEENGPSQNKFTVNPEVKGLPAELSNEIKSKNDTHSSDQPSSSDEQGSSHTADQMEDVVSPHAQTLDSIRQDYFTTSEMDHLKGDMSCLSDAICGLVNSDDADLHEALNECDSDDSS